MSNEADSGGSRGVMGSNRNRVTAMAAAVVLLVGGGVLAAALKRGGSPGPDASQSPTQTQSTPPTVTAPSHTPTVARGPEPPASGAWLGAWVKPDVPTQAGRLDAIASFETDIGRPLSLVHTFHKWTDTFPSEADTGFATQGRQVMISWAGEDTRVIQSGHYDTQIRAEAEAIKAWDVPILLRFRWEMNRPNLGALVWSPADYVAAWKHVRAIFTEVGATNAAWVWCPIATNFNATNGAAFYPGDKEVEWLCTDVYPGPTHDAFSTVSAEFLAFAAQHPKKPVIIGEFGSENKVSALRSEWLTAAFDFVKTQPQIKALVYFDALREENGVQRDFTLQGSGGPLEAFKAAAALPYFSPPVQ